MQPEQLKAFPLWIQLALVAFVGFGLAVSVGVFYFRKLTADAPRAGKEDGAVVLSATLADSRAVRELTDSLDQLRQEVCESRETRHRDSLMERECSETNTRALRNLQDTVSRAPGPINPDLGAMLMRIDRIERERRSPE